MRLPSSRAIVARNAPGGWSDILPETPSGAWLGRLQLPSRAYQVGPAHSRSGAIPSGAQASLWECSHDIYAIAVNKQRW